MTELFKSIEWDDYKEIFFYGNPPVYLQLLIFNGLLVAYLIYHKMTAKRKMATSRSRLLKFAMLGINGLILFQEKFDVSGMMDNLTF